MQFAMHDLESEIFRLVIAYGLAFQCFNDMYKVLPYPKAAVCIGLWKVGARAPGVRPRFLGVDKSEVRFYTWEVWL